MRFVLMLLFLQIFSHFLMQMATYWNLISLITALFNEVLIFLSSSSELARDALHKTGRYRVLAGVVSPASDQYQKVGLLPAVHRQAMVRLATQSSDWIRMDTWEGRQEAWTRTALVLKHMDEVVQSARQLADSEGGATASKRAKKGEGWGRISTGMCYLICALNCEG